MDCMIQKLELNHQPPELYKNLNLLLIVMTSHNLYKCYQLDEQMCTNAKHFQHIEELILVEID